MGSRKAQWTKLAALFCAVAPGVSALPATSASLPYLWPWSAIYQVVGVMVVACAAALCFASQGPAPARRRCTGLSASIAAILLAATVSTICSRFPERAGFGLLIPAAGIATGMVIYRFIQSADDYRSSTVFLLRIIGVLAIVLYLRSGVLWFSDTYFPRADAAGRINNLFGLTIISTEFGRLPNAHPFGHANYSAGAFVLTLPLCAGLAVLESSRWRPIWVIGFFAGIGVLLLTGSRAGVGAVLSMLPVALVLALAYHGVRGRDMFPWIAALTILAIGCALLHTEIRSSLVGIFQGSPFDTNDSTRIALAETGLQMGIARPLTGHGLATTSLVYPSYWNGSGALSNAFQLHTAPVQIFSDCGIIGLSGVTALFGSLVLAWRRLHLYSTDSRDGLLAVVGGAIGVGVTAYGLFSLTDYQFDVYFISGNLGILAGLLAGIESRANDADGSTANSISSKTRARFAKIGMLAFTLFFCWQQWACLNARYWYDKALIKIQSDDPDGFVEATRAAIRWAPTDPLYRNQLGWHLALAGQRNRNKAEAARMSGEAAAVWEASLDISESQEFCHFNLGWLYLASDPSKAVRHLRRAAELQPGKRGVYFGLALALRKLGKDDAAYRALALEAFSNPAFSTWALWDDPKFSAIVEIVSHHLKAYYAASDAFLSDSPRERANLHVASKISAWWWGYSDPTGEEAPFSLPGVLGSESVMRLDTLAEKPYLATPPAFCYLSWTEKSSSLSYLRAAQIQAGDGQIEEMELRKLADFVANSDLDYRGLLERARSSGPIPLNIVRNTRPAFGLFARNVQTPTPGDLFIYEQPLLLQLALEQLYPSFSYLPNSLLDEFLQELIP